MGNHDDWGTTITGNRYTYESFASMSLKETTFTSCTFIQCDFTGTDLTEVAFENCQFDDCNFSVPEVSGLRFYKAAFSNCKMMGILFTKCSSFGLDMGFDGCTISSCVFTGLNLRKMIFRDSRITECDFYQSDLSGADFSNAVLEKTIFEKTKLTQANFKGAIGYRINPLTNTIKKAQFSLPEAATLLEFLDIKIE